MSRFFNVVFLVLLGVLAFTFRERIGNVWAQSFAHYFPCKTIITYDIAEFDTRFGISKEDFIKSISSAENIWEGPANKDLFKYVEGGRLKINLVYDTRQETTQQLKKMGLAVENTKASYDALKVKYNSLDSQYRQMKRSFDTRVANFEARKAAYEAEVKELNAKGGASKTTYSRLNSERDYLNQELQRIKQDQLALNEKVEEINALAKALNQLAVTLNMNVDKFNTIGETLGGEFEEGVYISDSRGERINIYQFDNKTKLVRVLAHELGHALGLDHNEDSRAIMYRLNNGINEKLTNTDLEQLKTHCGIE